MLQSRSQSSPARFTRILQPGRNCWRIRRADRVAFLIDGNEYFQSLYATLPQAREQILISSWDIYSEICLGALQGDKRTLADTLDQLLHENKKLHAYLLNWDFSVLYAMSREWLPVYKFGWKTHPRLKFKLDDHHPVGASHHQKFVVLDDQLAFSGGLDITRGRWDTPEHLPLDSRRTQIDGTLGRPYHDVQIAVSGEAASALGDLFRERWRKATDEKIDAATTTIPIWPVGLASDLEHVDVAISRTEGRYSDYQEVREVEQLYLDAIESARDYIYIENQFFTAPVINQALIQRLLEENGPEIIINLPLETEGWLSQKSLDVIRVKLLHDLRKADRYNRLAVYYPYKKDLETRPINMHAKVMIIDDRFVRIGSANINNRSMGLDSECDIAIEAGPDDTMISRGIVDFRDRLLGEHLNTKPGAVTREVSQSGSLLRAIKSLRTKEDSRTLMPLEDVLPEHEENILTDTQLVDPEQPINPEQLLYHYLPDEQQLPQERRILFWLMVIILLLFIAGLWRFTGLGDWFEIENLATRINSLKDYPFSVPLLLAGFVTAGMIMVPVTVLIIATLIVFGPWPGSLYAMLGAVACGIITYMIGSIMGRDTLKGLAGGRIEQVDRKLARYGIMTIIVLRIVPVAPFTIINMVAGASHIRFRDFILGTILGMIPGITAFALLTDRIKATVENPGENTVIILLAVVGLILLSGYALSRYLRYRQESV